MQFGCRRRKSLEMANRRDCYPTIITASKAIAMVLASREQLLVSPFDTITI